MLRLKFAGNLTDYLLKPAFRWDKSRILILVTCDFQANNTANLRPKPVFTGHIGKILFFLTP